MVKAFGLNKVVIIIIIIIILLSSHSDANNVTSRFIVNPVAVLSHLVQFAEFVELLEKNKFHN